MYTSFALLGLAGASWVSAETERWSYQSYKSSANEPPNLNISRYGEPSPGYLFFTQTGRNAVSYSTFIMTDDNELVWQGNTSEYGNFRVQQLDGKPVLTYFNGLELPEPFGFGYGIVEIRDESYQSIYNVTIEKEYNIVTIDELDTSGFLSYIDMHEALVTPEGTMLVTLNNVTQQDLTSVGGPEDGWMVDSLFYEIDIKSNTALYRWRHSDHLDQLPLTKPLPYYPLSGLGQNKTYPWGPFHINSVEKFADGSYLISSRFYCSVFKVAQNGTVEWELNGQGAGDFELGEGLSFCYQHDARIHKETGNTYLISLFDNANSGEASDFNGLTDTRGLYIEVNADSKKANLVQSLVDPHDSVRSVSQGGLQLLRDGHSVMSYGSVPKIKEYGADGSILHSAQFGEDSLVQSYRSFRFPWTGRPASPPDVVAYSSDNGTSIYMSWNGATEHESWDVYAGSSEKDLKLIERVKKTGFETKVTISQPAKFVRVEAVGKGITNGLSSIISLESN